jgi:vitamin B12 transporter
MFEKYPFNGSLCIIIFAVVSQLGQVTLLLAEDQKDIKVKTVVTAHRYDTPTSKVANAVTVITEEDIKKLQLNYVSEVLKTVAYLDVVQSGGKGGNTSVFMRGANPEHTLVLLDGIELNNPVSTAHAFNFDNLTVDNIERIEIVRGSQTIMYGSDALGGVIAIYTKKGDKPETNLRFQAGSFNTFHSALNTAGKTKNLKYSLASSIEDSDGISAANERLGNNEDDQFRAGAVSLNLGANLSENLDLNLLSRYTKSKTDLDNTGGVGGDDLNRKIDNEQILFRTEAIYKHFDNKINHRLGFSVTDQETTDNNDPDLLSSDFLRSNYQGRLIKFDLVNNFDISDSTKLLVGVETEGEEASSSFLSDGAFGPFEDNFPEKDLRTNAVFSEARINLNSDLTLNIGARVDDNSEAGSQGTYRIAPVYCIADCAYKLTGIVGTGFKAPSLFQLFSSFGNPELESEESFNWELGVERSFVDNDITIGVNWFRNQIDNLITFDNATFKLENINEASIHGLETFLAWQINPELIWRADYSYTDTKDLTTQEALLRRARHKFTTELSKLWLEKKLSTGIQLTAIGSRADNNFTTFPVERTRLGGYALINLNTSYQIDKNVSVFGRVDNLLDQEYENVFGYGTYGLAGYAGVKFAL